jgi:hypothetical protein
MLRKADLLLFSQLTLNIFPRHSDTATNRG